MKESPKAHTMCSLYRLFVTHKPLCSDPAENFIVKFAHDCNP